MSSAESQQQGGHSHLQKQDLATLDITKLTPQSPEVISRQATINIGTIGHVAHGKSTVVKAISSVHTVRFKNELERNITIKLDQWREDGGRLVVPDFLKPEIRVTKLTKAEIFDLTKSENRAKNLKSFMRNTARLSRKRRRDEMEAEERKKAEAIRDFLEYMNKGLDMSKLRDEIAVFRPKHQRLGDIDRYSEISSISCKTVSECDRPRRVSTAPERFSNPSDKFKPKNPKREKIENPDSVYEVESIDNINLINNEVFVLVKWENYPPKDNTWEPLENVRDCEALEEFLQYEMEGEEEKYKKICQEILDEQRSELDYYRARPKRVLMCELKQFDPLQFTCYQLIYNLIKDKDGFYCNFRKKFRHMVLLNYFHELDVAQQKAHKKMRDDIMQNEMNLFSVSIVNDVDFTTLEYFKYVRENQFHDKVVKIDPIGCNCEGGCSRESKCCPTNVKGGQFAYKMVKDKKRLRINWTQMIFECNENCSCDENCLNRVTQQPRLFPLCIFKTDNGRGWGLKTNVNIPKGTYLMEYTGEVIDQEESFKRGEKYDEIGRSYLFDLDYNETVDATYTIDAFKCGNLSRLINHSCEPNCRIFPVTNNHQDTSIYKLCYFATRTIKAGEELTFDYSGGVEVDCSTNNQDGDDEIDGVVSGNNIVRRHKTVDQCFCKSEKCRGFIFN